MNKPNLLQLLLEQPNEYVSGEMISQKLGISRTAVWKQIRKLEASGFEIVASRKLGYKLDREPDEITVEGIKTQLKTKRFGQEIHWFSETPSTQDIAKQAAEAGIAEGSVFIADQQLNGRGRQGRGWVSPKGKGIYLSMVLRPPIPLHVAPQLTLVTAVALCLSLRKQTALDIGIKWPNDLLIEGKKISGILLESVAEEERLRYVIAGIGISVNLVEGDYPVELLKKATSLRLQKREPFVRTELIADFLTQWEQLYDQYISEGFEPIRLLWEELSVSLNKRCELRTAQGHLVGVPVGLDPSGAIRVELDDGTVKPVFSAEMGLPLG